MGPDELCLGCYRTLREIATWSQLPHAAQLALLDRLERRRLRLTEQPV